MTPPRAGDEPFGNFEHDVADESVGHDHVGGVGEHVFAFDVADEIHGRGIEAVSRLRSSADCLWCALRRRKELRRADSRSSRRRARTPRPSCRIVRAIPGGSRRSHPHRASRSGRRSAGSTVAIAGRAMPSIVRNRISAIARNAPLLPAETTASACFVAHDIDRDAQDWFARDCARLATRVDPSARVGRVNDVNALGTPGPSAADEFALRRPRG